MSEFVEIELPERADEHESVDRFCRLARAYTVALGWDDQFRIQGRVQGSQMRDVAWTPADGARTLHTLLDDYREYFEGIYFPRVDAALLGGEPLDETTIYAHGVGLRLLTVRGDARAAQRLEQLAEEVEAGTEPTPDASSPDPRQRRMALFAMAWPGSRADRDNKALAAEITTALRRAMSDEAAPVRATAVALVGRYRILAMLDDMNAGLTDGHASVRAATVATLRSLDEVAAIAATAPLLADDDGDVRRAAFATMRHAGHLPWQRRKQLVGDCAAALIPAWQRLDEGERVQALEWLVGCSQDGALQALLALRADPSERVRRKMIEVLVSQERDDLVPALVSLLDDPSEEVQAAILEALSQERLRAGLQADENLLRTVMARLQVLAGRDE